MNIRLSPTIALLNSSTLTALSGCIRLYLAFLLIGFRPDCLSCVAAGLIIYSIYTLDRTLESKEDEINKAGLYNARRDIGLYVSIMAFIVGAGLFIIKNTILIPFIPLIVGFFYSKGIRIRNFVFRLKGSLGGKNLVIGLTWGGTIALVIAPRVMNPFSVFAVFLFFFTKLFINSVIYDMKDVKGDVSAGIRTLPVILGDHTTKLVLAGLCVFIHLFIALSMITGILRPEIIILIISFLSSFSILMVYSSALERSLSWTLRHMRILCIDCEAPFTLILRQILRGQFWMIALYST